MGKTLRPQNLRLALRANSGLAVGTIYPLRSARNVIGRSVDATVPVDDSLVSRNHATIDLQNGFHYLVDLGSINGSFLNGEKLEHATLISVGDEIRVGTSVLKVELLEEVRNHVGKTWREPTRTIFRSPPVADTPEPKSPTGARWRHLVAGRWGNGLTVPSNRRWVSVFICASLVIAAIATTFGHPVSR